MATIETRRLQDGTTTFRAKVRLKGYSPEHATFTRKTDAVRWSQSTEAAMREGRYFRTTEAKRRTVAQLLDRYVEEVVPMRPRNACNTRRHVAYWRQMIGQLALADATPSVIVEQRNGLLKGITRRGTPRSHATVVRYLATLSHAFNIALKDWQWASDNPVAKITKPREARGRERFLSDAERLRLLETCQASSSRHLYTVVVLAISTGMRRGEIMNIRWHDVDLKRQPSAAGSGAPAGDGSWGRPAPHAGLLWRPHAGGHHGGAVAARDPLAGEAAAQSGLSGSPLRTRAVVTATEPTKHPVRFHLGGQLRLPFLFPRFDGADDETQ